jgi:hypothetical protein
MREPQELTREGGESAEAGSLALKTGNGQLRLLFKVLYCIVFDVIMMEQSDLERRGVPHTIQPGRGNAQGSSIV